jgi:hypothetical protein
LPQWAAITKDGEFVTNRSWHGRHKDARLRFNPKLLFSINWATSGPGFEWPEEYHVTYLPGFEKHVFTASRDGDDAFGCADHAIGVAHRDEDIQEAARKIITGYWRTQADGWDQARWEYAFNDGLIEAQTAVVWAGEVWAERRRRAVPTTNTNGA